MLRTWTSLAIAIFSIVHFVRGGKLSFCDGTTYVERSRDQCGAGLTFGETKPDCICVSGIYRFIADSCETADGFADNVCTKLSDDNGLGASIVGVKFTRDPLNWQQTGIVCERRGFGTQTWDFITDRHSRGSTTKSSNIYVVNGKAYMTTGHHDRLAFCVEPALRPENEKICRYIRSENEEFWKEGEIEVMVKGKCDGNLKPLNAHKCFGLLKNSESECQLACSPKSSAPVTVIGRSTNSKKPTPKPAAAPQTNNYNKARVSQQSAQTEPQPTALDPTHPTEYWKHDNKFLNRKMMIYNIISQLTPESNSSNNVTYGEPKRTFELYDMMKDITKKWCPAKYVSHEWLDLVINLFYIIHKGNIFKYDENLSEGEFEWIRDILSKCSARIGGSDGGGSGPVGPVDITTDPGVPDKQEPTCQATSKGGEATGFCNGTKPDGSGCNFVPVIVPGDRANDSYHYVPEVAWDIIDLIQVVCFPEFNVSYRMFHVLEQAAEKLFTLQVKNLWYYPNWSEKTKKRLLGTAADTFVHNLEVCIYSAYYMNGLIPRLVRPRQVKYLRKKRSVATRQGPKMHSEGTFVDVYCSRSRREFVTPLSHTCPPDV